MSRPEDRWRWVQAGLDLLREHGVRLNPGDARVRRELAWIYQHKIGTDMDRAAPHYRREWARTVATYLEEDGSPPAPDTLNAAEMPEALGLDPERMRGLDRRFGAMDWRVPDAHAVYWAAEALDRADASERLACRRAVYQPLLAMIRHRGRLAGDPGSEAFVYEAYPNPVLLDATVAFLEETLAVHRFRGVRFALAGLLVEGARYRAAQGRGDSARRLYARAADLFGGEGRLPSFEAYVDGGAEIDWDALPGEPEGGAEEVMP
jgi:hypothetical protein